MDKSPLTEKHLGITYDSHEHFADVRQRARDDWEDRHIKAKRNKKDPIPEYRIDQEIVIARGRYHTDAREYVLIKIIDFEQGDDRFKYYGIVLKVTDRKILDRVGRLICTSGHWFGYFPANVVPDKIKWLEEQDGKMS